MITADFIRANTRLTAVPLVPEIRLHLAREAIGLWERTEELGGAEATLPFWAFPWAGGQALARYVLDHPAVVRGRQVLDLGSGSGLVGIAAAQAGAAIVTASELDPLAVTALEVNAAANGVTLQVCGDLLAGNGPAYEVVLAGDLFYEQPLAAQVFPFLTRAGQNGASILVGDPGRGYLPEERFAALGTYDVPVWAGLEDAVMKPTTVWALQARYHRPR